MAERLEFPAPVDRAAYFIPTLGIVFLGACAAAIFFAFLAMASSTVRAMPEGLVMKLIGGAGVWAGFSWVWRRRRIHHERKLVIDDDGVTYFKFKNSRKTMRWDQIESVSEVDDDDSEGYHACLTLELNWGRFRIQNVDFENYAGIRQAIARRLPGRTRLVKPRS